MDFAKLNFMSWSLAKNKLFIGNETWNNKHVLRAYCPAKVFYWLTTAFIRSSNVASSFHCNYNATAPWQTSTRWSTGTKYVAHWIVCHIVWDKLTKLIMPLNVRCQISWFLFNLRLQTQLSIRITPISDSFGLIRIGNLA